MKKSLLFIVTLAISLTLCIAALTEASMTCSLNVEYDYEAAEKLLEIMNSYRESGDAWVLDSKGTKVSLGTLPPLVLDETLTDAAMQRASELVISFSHTRPDGSMCTTVNKAVTAENVGTFYSSPEAMFSAFAEENQPYANQGHRRNMLNSKYAYVGIGAIRYNGRWYWSMDFSYRAPQTEKVPERRTNDTPAVITVNPDSPEIKQSVATSVSYLQVHEGETVSLPAVYLVMGSARVEEVEDAVWTVSAPSVADVRGKQITGLKTGNTTVQYTANGVSRSITVSVLSAPVATATAAPTATPTGAPTSTPTPKPTPTPTPVPTPTPTPVPTPTPTPEPTIKVNFDLEGRQILHLPADLQEIGAEAFSGLACEAVIIPDSCTTIGERAFAGCDQLLYVYIPTSVTNISADAFDGCDNAVFEYEPCQHTNMVRTEYVAPTCTSDGYERTECADCHGNKTRTILNATGHNYVMHVVRAATIDEDGENQYVCQNCGATYSVPTVCYDETPTPAPTPTPTPEPTPTPKPPCQHTNMVRTAYVAPTCTSDGYEDTECADCHGNKTRTYLNATGHNYVMHVVRVATIDENGENQYVCQNCGDTYSVITVCYDE